MENKLTEAIGNLTWPGSDWLLWGHAGHQTIWMMITNFPLMTAWVAMLTFPLVWRSFLLLLQNSKTQVIMPRMSSLTCYCVYVAEGRGDIILLGCGPFNKEYSGKKNQGADDSRIDSEAKAKHRQDACGVHGTHSYISPSVKGTRKVLV